MVATYPHTSRYSEREELANMMTHALGLVLSIVGLVLMVTYAVRYGDPYRIVSVSIFGATLVIAYLASTLYHMWSEPNIKHVFRLFDHASIYLLIAGSYTPFTLVLIRGGWGWSLFGIVWGLAVFGIVFKLVSSQRFRNITVAIYLGMGWLGIVAAKPVASAMPPGCLVWVVLGGLMYTGGIAFYLWRKLPFHHAIWHLFVMAGSFSHFVAVYWYVLPRPSDLLA